MEVSIKNVDTKEDLNEKLKWVKFSGFSWTKGDEGFFYNRYPEPEKSEKLGAEVQ